MLGLGFEALGVGVARHWGLPETLQRCMRRPESAPPGHLLPAGPERLRWLALAANELAGVLWQGDERHLPQQLAGLVQRHGRALGLALPDLLRAAAQARQALAQMAPAMGLSLPSGACGQHLLANAPPAPGAAPPALRASPQAAQAQRPADAATVPQARPGAAEAPTVLLPAPAGVGATPVPPTPPAAGRAADVADQLNAGIHHITDTLAGDSFRLNQVLRLVLETMHRALGFQRTVFCLREPGSGRLTGRFGLGDRAAELSPAFQVLLQWPAGQEPDLFGAVCLKARDTLIDDSRLAAVEQRLPGWYRRQVNAPSFLLLPLLMKGAPFALIYADQAQPGGLQVGERELALLRTLRNQAVMAFRQSAPAG